MNIVPLQSNLIKMYKPKGLLISSIMATLLSVVSIILVLFRIEPITYDWLAVIVCTLTLLVTLLLGWQIFSHIKLRDSINKIVNDEVKNVKEELHCTINSAMSSLYYELSTSYHTTNKDKPYMRYICELNSILKAIDANEIELAEEFLYILVNNGVNTIYDELDDDSKAFIRNFIYNPKLNILNKDLIQELRNSTL